ncbi:YveK family protein [Cryptobacterium curtum]
MFNFSTVCESVRRHWIPIAIITAVCLLAGVGSSYLRSDGTVDASPKYTAEAAVYAIGYGYGEQNHIGDSYNYQQNETLMSNDIRRIMVSAEVAGEVRTKYGSNVTITVPWWYDTKSNSTISSRYVFVNVVASDAQTALDAAQEIADKTVEIAKDRVPVSYIEVAEPATLTSTDAQKAGDWGSNALVSSSSTTGQATASSPSLSVKNIVIFLFVGLAGSIVLFAAWDILSRRVRSATDVERLLDIPVLAHLAAGDSGEAAASAVAALTKRSNIESLVVCGASNRDEAPAVVERISSIDGLSVAGPVVLAQDDKAALRLQEGQAVLVVLREGASSGRQIENALSQIKIAGTPVLGAIFVSKK